MAHQFGGMALQGGLALQGGIGMQMQTQRGQAHHRHRTMVLVRATQKGKKGDPEKKEGFDAFVEWMLEVMDPSERFSETDPLLEAAQSDNNEAASGGNGAASRQARPTGKKKNEEEKKGGLLGGLFGGNK